MIESEDQQVLNQLTHWIKAGQKCWLATVVKTWGSSPRPVGSPFCCNTDGHTVGSLSGGCIEDDVVEKLPRGELADDKPHVLIYGGTREEAERLRLPCGGQLQVVIEPQPDQRRLLEFQQIIDRLALRACVERKVDIATGDMTVTTKGRYQHLTFIGDLDNTNTPGEKFLVQTYGPRYQLFLIGAGPVSMYLAQMAKMLDYHVVVCDPRESFIEQWKIEGVQLECDMPDDAIRRCACDDFSAIIALTHDPRIDLMGLMEALKTDAFFVGTMGSTRTAATRREQLLQLDLTQAQVNKLHAPVGLPLGSKTPAEIAIAILSQLTALRTQNSSQDESRKNDPGNNPFIADFRHQ